MGLGTGFAHAFSGSVTAKMPAAEAASFRLHSLVLGKMGNIGILLLLVSGFYMITVLEGAFGYAPVDDKTCVGVDPYCADRLHQSVGEKGETGDPEAQFRKMTLWEIHPDTRACDPDRAGQSV
jgi:hypothetical protein